MAWSQKFRKSEISLDTGSELSVLRIRHLFKSVNRRCNRNSCLN